MAFFAFSASLAFFAFNASLALFCRQDFCGSLGHEGVWENLRPKYGQKTVSAPNSCTVYKEIQMQDCIFVGQLFFVGGFFQSSWGFFTVPKQRMGLLEETFFSFSPFGAHCPCMRLHRHSQHGLLHLLSFFPIPLHPFPTLL